MNSVDFLILGGGAAGTTAAEVIRSNSPDSAITIITEENHEQYSKVLLPHYIRGKVAREQIFLKKPHWYGEKNINLLKNLSIVSIDGINHFVKLSDGEQYQYKKLLIAIGGDVIKINFPNLNDEKVCYLRTVEDADKILKVAKQSKKAVIIGGGFIGLEFASCFKANGVEDITTLIRGPYYWSGKLDEGSSKLLVSTLLANGIKVVIEEEVVSFESEGGQSLPESPQGLSSSMIAVTKSGNKYEADVIGVGIGIKSDFGFLQGSGIKIDKGIVTNEFLETNVADIYAAGDCAQFWDVVFEKEHAIGNWANATSQGRVVGMNMAGVKTVFETASGYTINYFDPPAGIVGGSCSFIGITEADYADKIIVRGSKEGGRQPGEASGPEGKIGRIFIKNIGGKERIVGATVINDPSEVGPLSSAIRGKVDVSVYIDKLSDVNFDLKQLIPS